MRGSSVVVKGVETEVLTVKNVSGGSLVPGQLVYIYGHDGTRPSVHKADADFASKMAEYVVLDTIVNNGIGRVAREAIVSGLDTHAAAAVGDPVYLSDTAGDWSLSAPSGADKLVQKVGIVTVDAVSGAIRFDCKVPPQQIGTSGLADDSATKTKLAGGFSKLTVADGTAAATDVTVSGMASGDELVSVLALATKTSIATLADRTSEYVVGTGKLVKAAGTDETDNQLIIFWNDLT